jgi:hypothetical protein
VGQRYGGDCFQGEEACRFKLKEGEEGREEGEEEHQVICNAKVMSQGDTGDC